MYTPPASNSTTVTGSSLSDLQIDETFRLELHTSALNRKAGNTFENRLRHRVLVSYSIHGMTEHLMTFPLVSKYHFLVFVFVFVFAFLFLHFF